MTNLKKRGRSISSMFSLKNVVVTSLLIYLAVFLVYPIGMALVGSFYNWNPLANFFEYNGFDNYKDIMTNRLFWTSMSNTMIFSIGVIFFRVLIGLLLALALFSSFARFKGTFRTIIYMPTITPLVAVSFVWVWLYNPQFGLINEVFGLDINWLKNKDTALGSVMLMTVWKDFGYATIIYLAGLMSLPNDCFEAADIDGATPWKKFKHITWPLLKPTTLLVVVTSLITYLQSYVQILVMTEGGPGTSTYTISYLIYEEAFLNYNFGLASAMSVILLIFVSLFTLALFKITAERS